MFDLPGKAGEIAATPREPGWIDEALLRGAVALTPHQRAARQLGRAFDAARQASGARSWQPANVLPWGAWIDNLWQMALVTGAESRVLLTSMQERALWERVIREGRHESLTPVASRARLCAGALRLLGGWDLEDQFTREARSMAESQRDAGTFARWFLEFAETCREEGFLPRPYAERELARTFEAGRSADTPEEYLVYGFDTLTPTQTHLLSTQSRRGAQVHYVANSTPSIEPPGILPCDDPADELDRCATWVRHTLESTPGVRIAIVVPDLDSCRPELERVLRDVVAPDLCDVTAPGDRQPPFEFSSGRPLHRLPMVADALRLLHWCAGEISVADAGALLYSRHCGLAGSSERGGEIDAFALRQSPQLRGTVSLRSAAGLVVSRDSAVANRLRSFADEAQSLLRSAEGTASFAAWADRSRRLLQTAGWPGSAALSSREFQAVDRWEDTLDRLATLDLLDRPVRFLDFLDELASAAAETQFAPENEGAPVQVMSVEESAGSTADAAWFLHASEKAWPRRQSPHPLLPWHLQQALGMPGTDAGADEADARHITERIARGAGSIVFSYASHDADGERRPSPLLRGFHAVEPAHAHPGSLDAIAAEGSVEGGEVEEIDDTRPVGRLPEGATHGGGADILTQQAQCPFRAFAEKRLFAARLEEREAGLTPAERGSQMHRILQAFWERVQDHEGLRRLSTEHHADGTTSRDRLLAELVDEDLKGTFDNAWDSAYIDVQRRRLNQRLREWLDVELERKPFTVVAIEKEIKAAEIGPLRLNLKVDRIDRVGEGDEAGHLLIDYKTGRNMTASKWAGDRPDQPQLPLYAVAGGIEDLRGIAFGSLYIGSMKLAGTGLPYLQSRGARQKPLEEQAEEWQTTLQVLASAYAAGEAVPNPKQYPTTCKDCGQRMLCRLQPDKLDPEDDLEDTEEEVWA